MTIDTYVLFDQVVLKNGNIMTKPEVVAELNHMAVQADQHDRIVGALRAKAVQLREALEWRAENQAGQRELLRSVTAERDAALARVAELEHVLRVVVNAADHGSWPTTVMHGIEKVREVLAGSAPPAKAQHSVPDGYRLIRLEHFATIKAKLDPEQVDAYRGRNIYDEDKVYANWNACRSALDEIKDVFQQIDWDAENELAELLAAAPGKEVPQAWIDVQAERRRQITAEGWTPEHDDEHACDEIAAFACFYAMPPAARDWDTSSTGYGDTLGEAILPEGWEPKTGDRRRELVKAAALILAEIERLDRAASLLSQEVPPCAEH
ncbi:hypothetical protein JET96_05895 [Pseudomonas aeruginosa]|uniref:Ead/Ea22-like family protein n=1 Tax=Pseudomonas aeruginosa TaxID=287 RepID=A0AAQ3LLZ3_PSEAI|nr:hypothetical protein [Pseudomonas aeruginosa]MBI7077906.1 hypothetical protein [Pseudomonas aeruginosa]MBI7096786.1 hypothetical protein [Pseudomonas aeruginosa]WOS78658.1 hypothetical protein L4V69_05820 [Pseudomonas aeruginosa]HEJ5377704.1 hypothetical protein [Pseudomonas aeruginosa]